MSQKKYHTLVFSIHALTNLHPGAGDSFYGAVDKGVQYDAATGLPTIYSHSLKGALREYFEAEKGNAPTSNFIANIFGTEVKSDPKKAKQGEYQFFSADLLALPVPERDPNAASAWHTASSDSVLSDFVKKIQHLGANQWAAATHFKQDLEQKTNAIQTTGDAPKHFLETAHELPVTARNQLNNGKSENLWYEEFIPHQAVFGAVVRAPENDDDLAAFIQNLDGQVVQIGANATVGYGYCRFTLLNNPLTKHS